MSATNPKHPATCACPNCRYEADMIEFERVTRPVEGVDAKPPRICVICGRREGDHRRLGKVCPVGAMRDIERLLDEHSGVQVLRGRVMERGESYEGQEHDLQTKRFATREALLSAIRAAVSGQPAQEGK